MAQTSKTNITKTGRTKEMKEAWTSMKTRANLTGQTVTSQLATYELIKQLGKGTFGDVYQALSQKDNTTYAIKIEWKKTTSKNWRSLLKMELKIMKALQQSDAKHTLYLIDHGATDTFSWILMMQVTDLSRGNI